MEIKGVGGTNGGFGRFFIGFAMMVGGGYLFLDAIKVVNQFGFHRHIYSLGSFNLTGGMVLIPFIFGIGIIFYNSKQPLVWILSTSSLIMLCFGIISNIKFHLRRMSAFELIMIFILLFGGTGLFLSSLRSIDKKYD